MISRFYSGSDETIRQEPGTDVDKSVVPVSPNETASQGISFLRNCVTNT